MGQRMVSDQLISNSRSVSKSACDNSRMVSDLIRVRNRIRTSSRWPQTTRWQWRKWKNTCQIWVLGRYIAMDRIDELNIGVGKWNLLIDTKIVYTLGVWWNVCKRWFSKSEWTFLWLDKDASNNTMGAFLGLVWLVVRFLKMGLLMSHDKTKTLELGI
jgi:hypothetical protein